MEVSRLAIRPPVQLSAVPPVQPRSRSKAPNSSSVFIRFALLRRELPTLGRTPCPDTYNNR